MEWPPSINYIMEHDISLTWDEETAATQIAKDNQYWKAFLVTAWDSQPKVQLEYF